MHVSKVRPELRAAVKESDGRGQQHMWPYDVDARFNRLQCSLSQRRARNLDQKVWFVCKKNIPKVM